MTKFENFPLEIEGDLILVDDNEQIMTKSKILVGKLSSLDALTIQSHHLENGGRQHAIFDGNESGVDRILPKFQTLVS